MGLFKRILSLGSKKSKKKRPEIEVVHNVPVDEVGCRPQASTEEDAEVALNLLLRSSSTRYAVVSETDCTALPPLPHPINQLLSSPSESTASLESTNLARRGTYTVTVHPREQPIRREPTTSKRNLSPQDAVTEEDGDASQLIRLRRDPSVASLLDLYDEHGQVPALAFSDSPEKQGRAQTKRSGSTLRQLLGEPSRTDVNETEGDISWAERYLGESSTAASSASSLLLQTPDNFEYQFNETHNHLTHDHVEHDHTFSSNNDLSESLYPVISSMEVELSVDSRMDAPVEKIPYANPDPKTPSRASQIFGFLTEKRRSHAPQDCDRSLPDPPSAFSSPSLSHCEDQTERPDLKTPMRRASQIFGFLTEKRRSHTPQDCERSLPDPPSTFSSPSNATHGEEYKGPYQNPDTKTPMRASQVFKFLTERRGSRSPEDCERSLPDPPSVFSSPSDQGTHEGPLQSRFSSDYSVETTIHTTTRTNIPATPIPSSSTDTLGHHRSHAISYDPFESSSNPQKHISHVSSRAPSPLDITPVKGDRYVQEVEPSFVQPDPNDSVAELTQAQKVKVIMTVPTKVIVTAPTPSNNPEHNKPPMRMLRGPRPRSPRRHRSSSSMKDKERDYRSTLIDRSNSTTSVSINDPFTPIISRPRKLQHTSSSNSINNSSSERNASNDKHHRKYRKPVPTLKEVLQKENDLALSVRPEVPATPMRTNSSRSSLFRTGLTPLSFKPPPGMVPSPASSSDLSPVGRHMMMEARNAKQKSRSTEGRTKSSKRNTANV